MKNNSFHLFPNIFCALQFLIDPLKIRNKTSTKTLRSWNEMRTKCEKNGYVICTYTRKNTYRKGLQFPHQFTLQFALRFPHQLYRRPYY